MTTAVEPTPAKRRAKVRYYRFKNQLKQKALNSAGGDNSGGPGALAAEALQAAEAEFDKMAEDYPDWVQGLIRRLYDHHGRCVDTPEQRHKRFRDLNEIAHDMKGQGGTFGYELISFFGGSLYDVTRPRDDYTDNQVEIVKAHIDAMNAVIKGRVVGDGGEIGKQLKAILTKAIEKYTAVE